MTILRDFFFTSTVHSTHVSTYVHTYNSELSKLTTKHYSNNPSKLE